MPVCAICGGPAARARRAAWEKLVYRACYECGDCKKRVRTLKPWATQFTTRVHCPRCGSTQQLKRRNTRDRIDALLWSPVSLIHRLLGGRLYHCFACRLQFYDLRKMKSVETSTPAR